MFKLVKKYSQSVTSIFIVTLLIFQAFMPLAAFVSADDLDDLPESYPVSELLKNNENLVDLEDEVIEEETEDTTENLVLERTLTENRETFVNLTVDEIYTYSLNSDVSIKFTTLPEGLTNFSVEKVTVEVDGEIFEGYEFESDMVNGTFSYEMTLPNPFGNTAEVKYSEDGINFVDTEGIVSNDIVTLTGDHFTVFVVRPSDPTEDGTEPLLQSTIINPATSGTWYYSADSYITGATGSKVEFVSGPATPPLGTGSLRLQSGDIGTKAVAMTTEFDGVLLADIESFGFDTYVAARNGNDIVPYINIYVDKDDDGIKDARLDFAGGSNGGSNLGEWKSWDLLNVTWREDTSGSMFTLTEYASAFPGVKIDDPWNTNTGGIVINAGDTTTFAHSGFDGNVDNFHMTVNGIEKIFDFEPADTTAPYVEITSHNDGDFVRGTVGIRGTVTDENPWRYYLVITNQSNSVIAGPGVVYEDESFTDKLFFNWNTTSLPDGQYTIKLEARDIYGNKLPDQSPVISDPEDSTDSTDWVTVTVDNTSPVVGNVSVATDYNPYVRGNGFNIRMNAKDDNEITCYYTIDGGANWNLATHNTSNNRCIASGVTAGDGETLTINMKAVDSAGNETLGVAINRISDLDKPVVMSLSVDPDESGYTSLTPILKAVLTDSVSPITSCQFRYREVGEPWTGWTDGTITSSVGNTAECEITFGPLTDSISYRFQVRGRDSVNRPSDALILDRIVDGSIPDTIIFTPVDNTFWNNAINITGASTDNIGVARVYLETSPAGADTWTLIQTIENTSSSDPFNWSYSWAPAAEGVYDIRARAEDILGNVENTDYAYNVTYDVTPPAAPTPISPADSAVINNGAFTQTWTSVVDAVQYQYQSCHVDPGDLGEPCANVRFEDFYNGTTKSVGAGQPDAVFWWRLRARDAAGNWSPWGEAFQLTIDSTPPILELTDLEINENDPIPDNEDFVVNNPEGLPLTCDFSSTDTQVDQPDLTKTITVTCSITDAAGNTTTDSATLTVHNNVPAVALDPALITINEGESVNFAATITGGNADFEYIWSGECTFGITETSGSVTFVNEGDYQCRVKVVDSDGDESAEVISLITVNNLAPSVSINVSPSSSVLAGTDVTLTAIGAGGNAPLTYNWTGDCAGTNNVIVLDTSTPRSYSCSVTLTDVDGDSATANVSISSSNSLPSVVIIANPGTSVFAGTTVTLTGNILGGDPNFSYVWSGSCSGSGTSSGGLTASTTVPNAVGTYFCRIDVTDANGDIAAAGVSITVSQSGVGQPSIAGVDTTDSDIEENDNEENEENNEKSEVLGAITCDEKERVSGFVFNDSNGNGIRDNDEGAYENIEIIILSNGEEIERVRTDANGKWETDLCQGNYNVKLNTDTLPENVELDGNDVKGLIVAESVNDNVDFALNDQESNQTETNWLLILLILAVIVIVLGSGYYLYNRNNDGKIT